MKYIHLRLPELLQEKGVSRTRLCRDLNLQRRNLNRYCRDDFQRIDTSLLIRLCDYLDCTISDLLEIRDDEKENPPV